MPPARITDITFASPPQLKLEELASFLRDDPGGAAVAEIVRGSAIETKGMAVNPIDEDPRGWTTARRMERALAEARALGRGAIGRALELAGLRPDEVGLLITTSTTVHSAPGLDALVHETGMRPDTEFLSLGPMGCYAAIPTLAACRNWVEVHGRPAVALCVDLFSPHLQPPPYDKEQAVVLTLFGDGAAAVVMRPGEEGTAGLDVLDSRLVSVPRYAADLQVHVGDRGMRIRLAPTMPDVTASAVAGPVDGLLARNGLAREDVGWWAVHPGGRRILDRVSEELDLPRESVDESRAVMREYGNTAAPAVLAVLGRLQDSRPLGPGEYGVAMAFGPGATVWSVLLRGA
ncbi:type III polyketide synthase [Actinomadura sp. WMMA1423]|uniref:type III polyketide synthase n=1 Tax=Actinomadura sp. WMMA1423 TaxID=2591108 RepID=UPI0011472801|nr:3-oxoacyl-[acyl-carrier-protein] synthase III C-terminal domain-containing protein [Actinomadura sp. WMMA1423]